MKRWRVLDGSDGWKLLCDPGKFAKYLERATRNKNGIAKFGPMQIRREPWPKQPKKNDRASRAGKRQ